MSIETLIIPVGQEPPPLLTPHERTVRDAGETVRPVEKPSHPTSSPPRRGSSAVKRRFGLLNAFVDQGMPNLSRGALAVWLLLYRHAAQDGVVRASVADLARRTGTSTSTAKRALDRLCKAGWVERIKRGTLAGGPSVWRLLRPGGWRP